MKNADRVSLFNEFNGYGILECFPFIGFDNGQYGVDDIHQKQCALHQARNTYGEPPFAEAEVGTIEMKIPIIEIMNAVKTKITKI